MSLSFLMAKRTKVMGIIKIFDSGMDLVNSGSGVHMLMMLCMKAFWGIWELAFTGRICPF